VFHRDHPERAIRLGPQADVRYVAISPDGRFVATGSHGHAGGLKVWETERGRLVKELPRAVFLDAAAAFSPGGRLLAVHGREGGRILTVGTREEGPAIPAGLAAFAPDGSLLAVDAGQGLIRLLDPATGRDKAHLEDPNQDTGSLLVKPDGTRLVAVSDDGKAIHVWDLQRIREELVQLDLDWNAPPYPKRADPAPGPLEIRVVAAE
jgi:WD40 repeat protein